MLRIADREPAVYSEHGPFDLVALLRSPPWHADALCKEYPDLTWFPGQGEDTTALKAVCARCLVARECLAAGMEENFGFWGGTGTRGRQRLRDTAA